MFLLQMIKPYNAARKTMKWTKKVVIHLLQIALLNAYFLYTKQATGKKMDFLKFQHDVS